MPSATHHQETLAHAINRMLAQGYSPKQVAGQVHRWHPTISPTQARSLIRAAGNPAAHTHTTYSLHSTARRVGIPVHASAYRTPQTQTKRHHGGNLFGAFLGAAGSAATGVTHGGEWVEHEGAHLGSAMSREAYRHAGAISAVAGMAAFVPGVGEVAAPVAIGFGALAAYHDRHHPVAVALDVGGVLAGGAALRLATRAGRLEEAAQEAWRLGPIPRWLQSDAAVLRSRARLVSASSFGLSVASAYPRPWVRNWSSLNPRRW